MKLSFRFVSLLFAGIILSALPAAGQMANARLWQDRGNLAALDLRYGPGSPEREPAPPFRFKEENMDGESPKFEVTDANGVRWVIKLGPESQSEVVASRLVWAMGYFAEESYYRPRAEIIGLPELSRGRRYVEGANTVLGARFEPRPEDIERGPNWDWLKNPFVGTREFNGLKAMMVLLANYDTSPANNRVLIVPKSGRKAERRFTVTDLGATLGAVGGLGGKRSKNNLSDYRSARLVKRLQGGMTEFQYRTRPSGLGYVTFVFSPGYWRSQTAKEKAMQRIPTAHVRWIGNRLSRLSDAQLRDAFRAAGYAPETMEGFIDALRERIDEMMRTDDPSERIARS